jgi:hypothetical protein
VVTEVTPARRLITADFPTVCGATAVVVELAQALLDDGLADPLAGVRIVLCDAGAARRPAGLLDRAAPGEILTTAAVAVVAGATLPAWVELLDRGAWSTGPGREAERVYQIRLRRPAVSNGTSSNLDWARRAVNGPAGAAAAAVEARIAELVEGWRLAPTGARRLALVTGASAEATTGFAAEAALRLHAGGAQVLHGRWEHDAGVPYRAFREALGVHADACPTAALRADVEGWTDEVAWLLPEVAARVAGSHLALTQSCVERARVVEAVGAWVGAISGRRPALLVLEDVQWAEPSSVLLLAHLWTACRRHPPMLLVTASGPRTEAVDQLLALVAHAEPGAARRIDLSGRPQPRRAPDPAR